ncbi:4Fe-4S binding protein [Desulfosporosinus sp. Sb-LF]|uniref:4Fe-4S binding protein n=1 Tax=Desulfosporosinus sp. Sb-LF TaxID=2560027 RepID=UPI00107F9D86|nr:4Fe-4S binding protein [Desulfosporosinus sp. Sb-LF]TGE31590.1 4Fe-4S binding protein [Desulfosporosinus sp. Sb-LF]
MFSKFNKYFSLRNVVQFMFAFLVLYIGMVFVAFIGNIDNNTLPVVNRPAGVEAFLPISALVGLKAWIATGVFDSIHPAGLIILLAAVTVSLLIKRTFCSWICPIGTLSEGLAKIGRQLFGRNFIMPNWLDNVLRSVKYIILFFFSAAIIFGMSGSEASSFLQTPYNMVSDVKMLRFFQNLSIVGMSIIGVLVFLSMLFENFWCRYLCPYGGLLGLFSILSPLKITRNESSCIQCGKCTKSCPNRINVEVAKRVWSPECTGCLKCVDQCPVKETLSFKSSRKHGTLSPQILALSVIGLWTLIIIVGKMTGHWETNITTEMYRKLLPLVDQIGL